VLPGRRVEREAALAHRHAEEGQVRVDGRGVRRLVEGQQRGRRLLRRGRLVDKDAAVVRCGDQTVGEAADQLEPDALVGGARALGKVSALSLDLKQTATISITTRFREALSARSRAPMYLNIMPIAECTVPTCEVLIVPWHS
jgi:hypothetical protein